MNKLSLLCGLALLFNSTAKAQSIPPPKVPIQISSETAQSYISNYKIAVSNFFAHGYLIDITKVKPMSQTGVRLYNGIEANTIQKLVVVPLDNNFKVKTGAPCMMTSDQRLCPKVCDIVSMDVESQIGSAQVSGLVNECMECRRYEAANAVTVFTPTLVALSAAGFRYVRIYNGQDGTGKRFVIYVPVDGQGREVMLENMYAGDNTSVLSNCKYP